MSLDQYSPWSLCASCVGGGNLLFGYLSAFEKGARWTGPPPHPAAESSDCSQETADGWVEILLSPFLLLNVSSCFLLAQEGTHYKPIACIHQSPGDVQPHSLSFCLIVRCRNQNQNKAQTSPQPDRKFIAVNQNPVVCQVHYYPLS